MSTALEARMREVEVRTYKLASLPALVKFIGTMQVVTLAAIVALAFKG